MNVLTFFSEQFSPLWTLFFRTISWAGSILVLAPVSVVIGYLLYRRKRRDDAVLLAAAVMLTAIVARLLKYLIGRERPDAYPALVETYTNLAFPSVHAAQISAFCLVLFLVLRFSGPWRRRLTGFVLFGLVLGVLCSRLYLQLHYPGDVVGGALLAVICVSGCALVSDKIKGPVRLHHKQKRGD